MYSPEYGPPLTATTMYWRPPMTYSIDGRQYIVVAVSGGPYSGEYIAFRLPGE